MPHLGLIEEIRISSIRCSPYNVRTDLGQIEGLLQSIDNLGLLQPLVVRSRGDEFEIVAGSRRFEACRRLGWRKVPCHIVDLDDREAFEVSLVENIQRRTLNPIEEAEAFRRYVNEYGWGGVSDLARRIGKSQEYVSKRMRLLGLPQEILNDLVVGKIGSSVAEELLSLDNGVMCQELGQLASSNHLTLKEIRSLTKMIKEEDDASRLPAVLSRPSNEQSHRSADEALRRGVLLLRSTLLRLDEIIDDVDDQWVIHEFLMEYRLNLHESISSFIKARMRLNSLVKERAPEFVEVVH
ncbi:MAG: ParB/RepB/Spo0J family partition protein [Thaumarchaeota archaeon]|nr:ParB/RepB/Spo0J family partition protein [Nitrososphaerota archaeon]MCL5318053.1 ParB/RepB/Spo0J family partition protein [Nitrososphaerota archaeon]